MAISFAPQRGLILICDFDMARVAPEMDKPRPVIVISPASYNRRHGSGPGRCMVVPFSASTPKVLRASYVHFPAGQYVSLHQECWACCDSVTTVSHDRLTRIFAGRNSPVDESLSAADLARIARALSHATGFALAAETAI